MQFCLDSSKLGAYLVKGCLSNNSFGNQIKQIIDAFGIDS